MTQIEQSTSTKALTLEDRRHQAIGLAYGIGFFIAIVAILDVFKDMVPPGHFL